MGSDTLPLITYVIKGARKPSWIWT
jgi:hypothetical protein